MRKVTLGILLLMLGFAAGLVTAQAPTQATDITAAQIEAFFKTAPPDRNSDRALRVVDAGGYRVGVAGVFRPKSAGPAAIIHQTKVAEVYYMLGGSGTLVTGGTLRGPVTPQKSDLGGWTDLHAAGIDGGTTRHIGKGDVVIIPGGVPHMWAAQESDISYLIFRPDPEKQIPLK